MNDSQTNVGPESATPAGRKSGSARGTAVKVAALLLATLCLVIGAACWFRAPRDGDNPPPPTSSETSPETDEGHFQGWPKGKPAFVLVLSGQQHGYLLPCGCSDPQYGGLVRRYNFVESLKARGWDVVAYDLGDVPQIQGPAKLPNIQGLIKYRYAMDAMKLIGYSAVSFGEYEAALPLTAAMDEYALNNKEPVVLAANLLGKDKDFSDPARTAPEWGKSYVGSWQVTATPGGINVGATGIIGTHDPEAIDDLIKKGLLPANVNIPTSVGGEITRIDSRFKFEGANKAVPAGLAAMGVKKPDFRVLLYQGPPELAKVLAQVAPQFNVILCVDVDEPPQRQIVVNHPGGRETFIVRVGHKGKYVGLVGVYATGKPGNPFEMHYHLESMGPKYATPAAKVKDHPIVALMENYTKELKRDDYLAMYGKVPHATQAALKGMPGFAGAKAGYAGSDSCRQCHPHAYDVWKDSKHHVAYNTLVTAKNPSLREYDAECIVCHTVGFRYQDGFANEKATPKLKDVGCESCHGPCDIHKKNPNNAALYALINPWKAPKDETPAQKGQRMGRIEGMCRECHDEENDVHWNFAAKWVPKKIIHMTPPPND
ncbi:MAG TPA: multiheme c-type cytochrome [Gemmataceae bacterium]|nr:multiheme c-type cytochrome [Gemmataceae bacterium]